jgi:hypothetical protein
MTSGGFASGGSATGGSQSDGGIVVTPDASARSDSRATDVLSYTDFGELLDGTWLAGWKKGDARHYSWIRISGSWGGTAEYLSGADLPSNTPLWPCSGQGTWFLTESYYSILLRLPSTCPSGSSTLFTFREFPDAAEGPPGATYGMITMPLSSGEQKAEWWRFPDDQCDVAMSACKSPF